MAYKKTGAPLTTEKFDRFLDQNFGYDDFEKAAKENGWLAEGQSTVDAQIDKDILKAAWNNFCAYDEKNRYRNGLEKTGSNAKNAMEILDDIMTQKLPSDKPYEKKSTYINSIRDNALENETKNLANKINNDYLYDKLSAERALDPAKRNEVYKHFPRSFGDRQKDLLMAGYDNCIDKDGKVYRELIHLAERYSDRDYGYEGGDDYSVDRKKCLEELKAELDKIPEDKRTDKQKDIIRDCEHVLTVDIPYQDEKKAWADKIIEENGFYSDTKWHETFYDIAHSLKDKPDHPFHKVIKEIENGRVPEYNVTNVKKEMPKNQSTLYTALITDVIFKHAEEALKDDGPLKDQLLAKIDEYKKARPNDDERIKQEAEDAPYEEAYKNFTKEDRKKLIEKAQFFVEDGNRRGNGETEEFKNLVNALNEAGDDKKYLFRSGHALMAKLDRAIQEFQASEHNNLLQNANVILTIDAQEKVNPEGAKITRQNLANDIYDTVKNTKKEWYDRKNTTEFGVMLDAMKTYCETDPDSEGYAKAAEDLENATKEYLRLKKGGLGTEAIQAGGEERRQRAVLALSLVNPEEAERMVREANKTRAHQIDLNTLKEKTSGSKKRREIEKESKLRAAKMKRARKAAKNKAKAESLKTEDKKEGPVIEAPKGPSMN